MLATSISSHKTQQLDDMTPGDVCHGFYRCPWPSGICSGAICQFTISWAMPGTLGLFYFALGGVLCHFIYQCILKQNFAIRGNIRHGLCHCPWQSSALSSAICLLATSWSMPGTLDLFYFALGVTWGAKTQPMEK
jgi:hypothetical protein